MFSLIPSRIRNTIHAIGKGLFGEGDAGADQTDTPALHAGVPSWARRDDVFADGAVDDERAPRARDEDPGDPFELAAAQVELAGRSPAPPEAAAVPPAVVVSPAPLYAPPEFTEAGLTDPVVQGLPDKLKMRRLALDPEDYSFIRTLGETYRMNEDVIRKTQAGYAEHLSKFRLFLSMQDEVPGFSRFAILGPGYSEDRTYTILGVTRAGMFINASINAERDLSVAEVIDQARNSGANFRAGADFNLNRHSAAARYTATEAAGSLLNLAKGMAGINGVNADGDNKKAQDFWRTLKHVTRARLSGKLELTRWALANAMAPDAIRAMRSTQRTSSNDAEWFSAFDYRRARKEEPCDPAHPDRWFGVALNAMHDPIKAQARVQAVKTYPVLAKRFLEGFMNSQIDGREPLVPHLAVALETSEASIRNLNGLTWQRMGVKAAIASDMIHPLLDLPRNIMPRNRAEHKAYRNLNAFRDALDMTREEAVRHFSRGGSPWRFAQAFQDYSHNDVRDMALYVVNKLALPARHRKMRALCEEKGLFVRETAPEWRHRQNLASSLLRSLPPSDMFELTDRWHRNLMRHNDRLVALADHDTWTALDPGAHELPGGITARELASSRELKAQGKNQNHCVGGYDGKVRNASHTSMTTIWSLEKDGKIVGTAELCANRRPLEPGDKPRVTAGDHGWRFQIIQNRGHSNDDVGTDVVKAADALCSRLAMLPIEQINAYVDQQEHNRSLREGRESLPQVVREAGYDVWDDEAFEKAWDELSGYLPRGVRKKGLQAFVDAQDIGDVDFSYRVGGPVHAPFWEFEQERTRAYLGKRTTPCENSSDLYNPHAAPEPVNTLEDAYDDDGQFEYDEAPF